MAERTVRKRQKKKAARRGTGPATPSRSATRESVKSPDSKVKEKRLAKTGARSMRDERLLRRPTPGTSPPPSGGRGVSKVLLSTKIKESSGLARWEYQKTQPMPNRIEHPSTVSSYPVKAVYLPEDLTGFDHNTQLGMPGEYPFVRGIYPDMYRGRLWTMRQFSGFGSAYDTNERYKFLLKQGQTGLSVAFDMPTLMGYDSDHEFARGEVGKCGVAIASREDMEVLFDAIPLDKISTSMTINPCANVLLAFYICAAEKQGTPSEMLTGTVQNDILKEYQAQKEWIVPPRPAMRFITDMFAYCSKSVPKWNTISISGYHIREAGSTALQELAFTLSNGIAYVQAGIETGLDVDEFAPRLSFFFNSHIDFFEEIAKFRAAKRIWARVMRERFKARNPKSWILRFHTQTAGCSLTAQQPYNNVIRSTTEALAAVLGGTQSLHVNSMDEVLGLPTEKAAELSLRTQQVIAYETGAANTIDPLGGSYFVEKLTNEFEEKTYEYFDKIEALGGVIPAIEKGFFQKEIANSAYQYQQALERHEKFIVGVNAFETGEEIPIEVLRINEEVERLQRERLAKLRESRDKSAYERAMENLRNVCESERGNTMEAIVEATRNYATLGEICDLFREIFGTYREPSFI